MKKEKKERCTLYLTPSTYKLASSLCEFDNCKNESQFTENAIKFYAGYVQTQCNADYLPKIMTEIMKSILNISDNRMTKMLFKLAVEQAMLMNVVAADCKIDDDTIARLRENCIDEVKRTNGNFSFEDAVRWQR